MVLAERAPLAEPVQASSNSNGSGGSTFKEKLHHLGEKLALVPPTQQELAQRLDKAERAGDEEEVSKLHMRVAASGQNASTSQEEVPV